MTDTHTTYRRAPAVMPDDIDDAPVDTRVCPTCAGCGFVEYDYHHPYYGERVEHDTCPDCDGSGETEVEPVDQDDVAEIPSAADDAMRHGLAALHRTIEVGSSYMGRVYLAEAAEHFGEAGRADLVAAIDAGFDAMRPAALVADVLWNEMDGEGR